MSKEGYRFDRLKGRITPAGLARLAADAALINLSVLAALVIRFAYFTAFQAKTFIDFRTEFWFYLRTYTNGAWLLTLISIAIFTLSGFYTYGRFYRGRYKILIVIQAVAISYLIFGLVIYFINGARFEPKINKDTFFIYIPRAAFLISWLLSTLFLVAARVWSSLWRNMIRAERAKQVLPEEVKIHTVLVIGGAGYIGSALLPRLLDKGYYVVLLDLLLYGTEPIQDCLGHPHLTVVQADFRQIDKVVEVMRNVDAVIHLGGIVGDPACALDSDLTTEINLISTRMIAEVAKGSGVGRFIFASTCSVYGASVEKLDERSTLNPVSLYARSKIASEKVLSMMADVHFAPVILRLGTIYGLSGRTRFDLVVNLLTAKAVVDQQITIFGGEQWRPFLHVDDAALALIQVLEAPFPQVRNQIFNVGSNEQNYTIRQIGDLIHRHVPNAEVVEINSDVDPRNYWVDFSKIKKVLGFTPQWTVEKGIEQVIQAINSGKVGDYKDARYSNVKFLTEEGIFRLARRENGWAYQLLNETDSGVTVVVDL